MANPNEVYSVKFDVTSALEALGKLEAKVSSADRRARELLRGGEKSEIDEALKRTSDRALKTRSSFEKARQAIDNLHTTGSKGAKKQTTDVKKLTDAGKALDAMMRKYSRNTANDQKKIAGLAEKTRQTFQRTDDTLKKVSRSAGRAAGGMRRFGSASGIATQSLTGLIAKTSAFIGVVAGLRDVSREYGDFDQAATAAAAKFSRFNAALRPGTQEFQKFKEEMRSVATQTEHSAAGVARAMDFWAKAGRTPEESQAVLKTTLDFASANQDASGAMLDVARAGDILSDVLGQFKLNSEDTTQLMANTARVADVMTAAANSANVSAEELFDSFKGAGPIMKVVGSDIEETSALLAAMANAGIKEDVAGTQLKMSISNLSAMTGPQEAMMAKLGVTVKDSEGNFRGLTTIIRDLTDATKDMGTADRAQIFAKAIGRRALPAFVNLIAEGQEKLDAMTASLRKADGETGRIADTMRQSAQAQMANFRNKLRDVGFEVIEKTGVIGHLTAAIHRIDWRSVYETIRKDVVPALKTFGGIITGTIIPAFQRAYRTVSTVLSPAFDLLGKLFGSVSGESKTAAKVLGDLIALWVAYRGYLFAVKTVGIIGWFRQLIAQMGAATAAQGAFNAQTATTNSTLLAQVKGFGKLQSALGVLTAAFVGWEIGTIIHDKLVEPFMEARHQLQLLRAEFEQNKKDKDDPRKKTFGATKDDLKTAREMLAVRQKALKTAKTEGGGAYVPQLAAQVADAEKEVSRLENKLSLLKTEANIKKYDVSSEAGAYESRSQSGNVTEYEEDFSPGSYWGPMSSAPQQAKPPPVLPIDEYGQSQSFEMTEILEELGQSTAEFQKKSLELMKNSESKTVTQNIDVGPTNVTIHATGANAEEVKRIFDREAQKAARQQRQDYVAGLRTLSPAEL